MTGAQAVAAEAPPVESGGVGSALDEVATAVG
jgi:hypothetical protein